MTRDKIIEGAKRVLASITELELDNCDVTVLLASVKEGDDEPQFEKLQLTQKLTNEFRRVVEETTEQWRESAENNDLRLVPYVAGSKPESHEMEFLDLSDHESINAQIRSLSSIGDVPLFRVDPEFVEGLRFYVIAVQCGNSAPVYLFRSYTPKKELSRSKTFAAVFSQGTFDEIRDPVFLFDRRIHCVSRDRTMLVCNKDSFHKIFRFFEMVLKTARKTLGAIKDQVPIANFDEFKQACEGHLQMQAKLKNIASKPYLKNITMKDIKKVLKEVPGLNVLVMKKNGREMLVFDPSDKWALLRLLDDDYLKSLLTGKNYEVSGKRPI